MQEEIWKEAPSNPCPPAGSQNHPPWLASPTHSTPLLPPFPIPCALGPWWAQPLNTQEKEWAALYLPPLASPSPSLRLCSWTSHLLATAKWSSGEHLAQAGQSEPFPEVSVTRERG